MSELHKALLKYQMEGVTVSRNATNPHFRSAYATLEHITGTVVPILNKYKLVLTQEPTFDDGVVYVKTTLTHADSGESISCNAGCSTQDGTAQKVGSAITYLRRYGFSLIGLVTDDDDDGNGATAPTTGTTAPKSGTVGKVEGKEEQTAEEKKENGMRRKIVDICKMVAGGDKEQAGGILFELTEFKEGTRDPADLMKFKGKLLGKVYAQAKKAEEDWKATSGGVESADDDGSTYNPETGEYTWGE
jgi:hypothetical protein